MGSLALAVAAETPGDRHVSNARASAFSTQSSSSHRPSPKLSTESLSVLADFEPNVGQAAPEAKFLAHGRGFELLLSPDEAAFALQTSAPLPPAHPRGPMFNSEAVEQIAAKPSSVGARSRSLRMRLIGANSQARMSGINLMPGKANYFIGRDQSKWLTGVPNYAKVGATSVYPGIDVVYEAGASGLEFDVTVAPGADPGSVKLAFDGADRMDLDSSGDVVLRLGERSLTLRRPAIYQLTGAGRKPVKGGYRKISSNQIRITVANYDRKRPLVIDPTVIYSTYFGGFAVDAQGSSFDSAGQGYLVGGTCCMNDLPMAGSPAQKNLAGSWDAMVAKFSSDGSTLMYSTYLGGSGFDISGSVAVDAAQNVFVYGDTTSADFPVMKAFQSTLKGAQNAFVAELDSTGALVYSTYLGGSGSDSAYFIGVDSNDSVYLDGYTTSTNFPVTPSAFQSTNPSKGVATASFVTRLDPPVGIGSVRLGYSTYFGGAIAAGGDGVFLLGDCVGGKPGIVYVAGSAGNGAPVTNSTSYKGTIDAIVAEFDTTKSKKASLVYSTYLGGSGLERRYHDRRRADLRLQLRCLRQRVYVFAGLSRHRGGGPDQNRRRCRRFCREARWHRQRKVRNLRRRNRL